MNGGITVMKGIIITVTLIKGNHTVMAWYNRNILKWKLNIILSANLGVK